MPSLAHNRGSVPSPWVLLWAPAGCRGVGRPPAWRLGLGEVSQPCFLQQAVPRGRQGWRAALTGPRTWGLPHPVPSALWVRAGRLGLGGAEPALCLSRGALCLSRGAGSVPESSPCASPSGPRDLAHCTATPLPPPVFIREAGSGARVPGRGGPHPV